MFLVNVCVENTKIMGEFPTGQAFSCKGFKVLLISFVFYKKVPYFREFFVIALQNGSEKWVLILNLVCFSKNFLSYFRQFFVTALQNGNVNFCLF